MCHSLPLTGASESETESGGSNKHDSTSQNPLTSPVSQFLSATAPTGMEFKLIRKLHVSGLKLKVLQLLGLWPFLLFKLLASVTRSGSW